MNDQVKLPHQLVRVDEGVQHAKPLRIEYSVTRVLKEAANHIAGVPGIVSPGRSELSDAFKVLRTQVLHRMRQEGWTSLAITAAQGSHGKSVAAINLALTIAAEFDKTALLIDADLAAPRMARLFGLTDEPGLTEHLLDGAPISEIIINPGIQHLVLIPAGRSVINSSELLATDAATRLFAELESRYPQRYVLLDSPPVLTADGLSLFEKVDAVLLVAERHTTSRRDLEKCAELLKPFNLIGSVVTEAVPENRAPSDRHSRA